MKKELIIVRGAPGSGKSTFANKLIAEGKADVLVEMDMFRQPRPDLPYLFSPLKQDNKEAFIWCSLEAKRWLNQGMRVIVANTFTSIYSIQSFETAVGVYASKVYRCENTFGNVHDVPSETVKRMRQTLKDNPYAGEVIIKVEAE